MSVGSGLSNDLGTLFDFMLVYISNSNARVQSEPKSSVEERIISACMHNSPSVGDFL